MKSQRLLRAIGGIDDKYIEEAAPVKSRGNAEGGGNSAASSGKSLRWIKWCGAAAGICAVVFGAALLLNLFVFNGGFSSLASDGESMVQEASSGFDFSDENSADHIADSDEACNDEAYDDEADGDNYEAEIIDLPAFITEVPFADIEELYQVYSYDIPDEICRDYGYAAAYYEGDIYLMKDAVTVTSYYPRSASITRYNTESGELSVLFEVQQDGIGSAYAPYLKFLGIYDSRLYYLNYTSPYAALKSERDTFEFTICSIDLDDGSIKEIFTCELNVNESTEPALSEYMKNFRFTGFGGSLYFWSYTGDTESDGVIYRYDADSQQLSAFRENARSPMSYKNGIIYFSGGNLYYCDLTDSADSDEQLFELRDGYSYYSSGDCIFYTCSNQFGIADESGDYVQLAEAANDISAVGGGSGAVFLTYGTDRQSSELLIYDPQDQVFVRTDFKGTALISSLNGIYFITEYDADAGEAASNGTVYVLKRK